MDQDSCTGCQDCVERCFFNAIEMKKFPSAKKLKASVDREKCFGCGVLRVGRCSRCHNHEVSEIACLVQVEGFNEEG